MDLDSAQSAPTQSPSTGERPFQILALDGGGIKGLFTASLLKAFEDDLGCTITDHFDLITGTSTGGIIALALGLGKSPQDIVDFYLKKGPSIFRNPLKGLVFFKHLVKRKFNPKALEEALMEVFGGHLLGHSQKRLVIPSYSNDSCLPCTFKTRHHPNFTRDWKRPMVDIALATSAAPTYFPASTRIDNIRHLDGGLWANNPILVGLTEAVSYLEIPVSQIKILSLGTTGALTNRSRRMDHGGLSQWAWDITNILMDAQSNGATFIAHNLLGDQGKQPQSERILRINPTVPPKLFELDRIDERRILSLASETSKAYTPRLKEMFLSHQAPSFTPLP
ncbi:CBASS cGAMP-activated phospholipase [Deinococcus cellulosilyticus]|uniref:PNPLA domain-containing protein n=1 Tax=Deinococcus cellulosilyticus (strain DSM 18568 / NBRC 106333 / KACC 11606 / 5516J-15) TaxID=1223518 RepID=A0A511NC11_DEIC1|nr:CBASS cGAMP-activated phospholipase [Deinococcus cellulosilyticus]GEM50038.1 hypothetical protein similar to Patatin [Deinococcus cellulosilyticus NBRC 106333 = KACC 11606]